MNIRNLVTHLGLAHMVKAGAPMPRWPPDVFAIAALLLRHKSAYAHILSLAEHGVIAHKWAQQIHHISTAWQHSLRLQTQLPPSITQAWEVLIGALDQSVDNLWSNHELLQSLLLLLASSDEASAGFGLPPLRGLEALDSPHKLSPHIRVWVRHVLSRNNYQSLCQEIPPQVVKVLPKQHTPQLGLTLRSFSHHLGLIPRDDIAPIWHGSSWPLPVRDLPQLNVLLLPWPFELSTEAFQEAANFSTLGNRSKYGYFDYCPPPPPSPEKAKGMFCAALETAERLSGKIDLVVLPELALCNAEYDELSHLARSYEVGLISGIFDATTESGYPQNQVRVDITGLLIQPPRDAQYPEIKQAKHHRWALERSQIVRYGLAGHLSPHKIWWEATEPDQRSLSFLTLDSWLTMCVLICEDLARQDPAAEVLRTIGPNLVIALLMDGPQLGFRWPARYASVLAEDPGSAVLTLTSLGMSKLGRVSSGADRSNVIARWRDPIVGEEEITLRHGENAAVLTLTKCPKEEYTADGRGDHGSAYFPIYSGYNTFKIPQSQET